MIIKIMTFNIRRGLGSDLSLNLERTAKVIAELQPDVVCLQEVFSGSKILAINQHETLSRLTGMNCAFDKSHSFIGLGWGNSILAKHQIIRHGKYLLTSGLEKRICQYGVIKFSGREFIIFNTHFGLSRKTRMLQKQEVDKLIGAYKPNIVCGDFNYDLSTEQLFTGLSLVLNGEHTYPAHKPRKSIDNIIYKNNLKLVNKIIPKTMASDHLPVYAEFEF